MTDKPKNAAMISWVDLRAGFVQRTDGERVPITNWIFPTWSGEDDKPRSVLEKGELNGRSPVECSHVVAGPDAGGKWLCAQVLDADREMYEETAGCSDTPA